MIYKTYFHKDLIQLSTLSLVTRAYATISSIRMKRVRQSVLITRIFLEEINKVFIEVLYSYQKEALKIAKRKRKNKNEGITFLAHNGRSVAVLVSANAKLYGDLIIKTFDMFIKDIEGRDIEVTIIGRHGLSLFKSKYPGRPFSYFDFSDYAVNQVELSALVSHLVQYEKIEIYYPKFQNAINQSPTKFEIASKVFVEEPKQSLPHVSYLFEPSLENILMFFETEIFFSLFEQSLRETQLAKYASRLFYMDRASEKVRSELKSLALRKMKYSHEISNKKQTNMLSGMHLW